MTQQLKYSNHGVATFATHEQAERAIKELQESGFEMKQLSIIGQDFHSEEHPIGCSNANNRMLSWGKYGAFWGVMWGLLFGSAFMIVPGLGAVAFAGYVVSALEGAIVGGSIGVVGAALTSLGIPDGTVLQYESAIKAGSFLVLVHGSKEEVDNARTTLHTTCSTTLDDFSSTESIPAGVR